MRSPTYRRSLIVAIFYIVLGLTVLIGSIAVVWRLFSNRSSIPCPAWLSKLVEMDNPLLKNNSARQIVEHLTLMEGMNVLDFGCGPGRLTIPVAKQIGSNGEVTAFDIQDGMLQRVREKAQVENIENIRFIQGEAGSGKLDKDRYDRALMVTVVGEIPDKPGAMAEVFNSLKPGGILSVTEVIADPHFQKRGKVRSIAYSVGFIEREFFGNRMSYTINFEKPQDMAHGVP